MTPPGMSEYWTPQPARGYHPVTTTPNSFFNSTIEAIGPFLTAKGPFWPGKAQEQATC
jgi:hypothetical protein